MNVRLLIDECINKGITLRINDGELIVSGAKEMLGPDIVHKIKDNKNALIDYMTGARHADASGINMPFSKTSEAGFSGAEFLAAPLDFSLFYFGSALAHQEEDDAYRLFIDGSKYADRNGYTAIWMPERHFNEFGCLYPSPSVLGAALAVITKNVAIRAGSVVIPLNDPLRVAEEWSVVDNLSGGRVGIACASGWQPNDFVLNSENYHNRHSVMYHRIDTIRKLWRGESILLKDGNGHMKDTRIFPKPVQRELPLWITSSGNIETFITAGKLGLNILTHLLGESVEELKAKIDAYRNTYRESGFDVRQSHVTLMLHAFIDDDMAKVYEKVKKPLIEYLRTSADLVKKRFASMGYTADVNNISEDDLNGILEFSFHRYVSHSSLIGTKSICKNMLYKLSGIGVNEIASLIDFGVDYSSAMESLESMTELMNTYNMETGRVPENLSA